VSSASPGRALSHAWHCPFQPNGVLMLMVLAQGLHLLQDLLSVEVPLTLNEAFCEHHRRRCPPSEELERECGEVAALCPNVSSLLSCFVNPVEVRGRGPAPSWLFACAKCCRLGVGTAKFAGKAMFLNDQIFSLYQPAD